MELQQPDGISTQLFNFGKTDYAKRGSLFLGEDPGLFDTVHDKFPEFGRMFKIMRTQDWDETEFKFGKHKKDFLTRPKSVTGRMIKTLAWQWEADSAAAKTIAYITAPFVTSSQLSRLWVRITDNEALHAATYSEIVRNSFDDPGVVLKEVMEVKEAMQRLAAVGKVMEHAYRISNELAAGKRKREDPETYDAILLFVCALLCLERIQFMASFAITFAIGATGDFVEIAEAVKRICQDELEVHQVVDKMILKHELSLPEGRAFWERNEEFVTTMVHEVVQSEWDWIDYLDLDNDPLAGVTSQMLKDRVAFDAGDVCAFMGIKPKFVVPRKNPASYMDKWIDMSKIQNSNQEQNSGQYKLNIKEPTLGDSVLVVDF